MHPRQRMHFSKRQGSKFTRLRLPLEREHRDLGPYTETPRKSKEAKSSVDIQISILFICKTRPIQIAVLHRAPSKVVRLYAELRAMRVPRKREVNSGWMIA